MIVSGRAAGLGFRWPASITRISGSRTTQAKSQEQSTLKSQVKPLAPLASDQFFDGSTTNALTASKWAATNAGPFTSAFTAGNTANFATVNGTGSGAGGISVGGIVATENFTFSVPTGTLATGGTVAPVTVSAGKTLNLGALALSTAAGTGFTKNGAGAFLTGGGAFTGGFTMNLGTLVAGGVNAMGAGGALTINGGSIAGSANRDFTGKYTSGITVGGDFQLGELSTNVASSLSTANLTFSNNMALGAATRTITIGANGTYTLGGIISGGAGTGLTIANGSGATGTLTLSGANSFTGGVTINAGILKAGSTTALGPAANATLTFGASSTGKFQLNGNNTTVVDLNTNATVGTPVVENSLTATTSTLTDNTAGTDTYAAVLQNGASRTLALTKSGAGSLLLTGTNTYTGLTTVSAGTLQLNKTGGTTIPAGNAVSISGTGNLQISSNQSVGNLTMTAGTLTIDPGVTLTITGTYSGSGGTIKNQGTIKLNGAAASFPGSGVTVNNGTAGTLTNLEAAAGAITLTSSLTVSGTLTVSGGSLANSTFALTVNGPFAQTGGTFTGGSGAISFIGTFTLSTGTFTASSTTTSFSSDLTQTSGTFAPNSGTVEFIGSTFSLVDVPSTLTLNNVTINKGIGWTVTIQTGDTLIVNGTLTLTQGLVDATGAGSILTMGSGATATGASATSYVLGNERKSTLARAPSLSMLAPRMATRDSIQM